MSRYGLGDEPNAVALPILPARADANSSRPSRLDALLGRVRRVLPSRTSDQVRLRQPAGRRAPERRPSRCGRFGWRLAAKPVVSGLG